MRSETSLKRRMMEGARVSGIWLMTPSVEFAELVRHAGLDFVVIDLEHGLQTLDTLVALLRVLHGGRTAAIVRVPNHDPSLISRVLDRGADGVMVPKVHDAAVARALADAARFPPIGTRGLALRALRASSFGQREDYRATSDSETLMIVQIETADAVANIEEICAVPGLDMAFIGPNDLSGALGLEGPENAETFARIVDDLAWKIRRAGRLAGAMPAGLSTPEHLKRAGVQLIVHGSDIGIMNVGLMAHIQKLRAHGF